MMPVLESEFCFCSQTTHEEPSVDTPMRGQAMLPPTPTVPEMACAGLETAPVEESLIHSIAPASCQTMQALPVPSASMSGLVDAAAEAKTRFAATVTAPALESCM